MTAPLAASRRRVVVTGLGAVTPLGLTFVDSWRALCRGESGLTSLREALAEQQLPPQWQEQEQSLAASLSCQVAAPVRGFVSNAADARKMSRFVQMALSAATDAMAQAGLTDKGDDSSSFRHGVAIGSGMSSVREIVQAVLLQQQQQQTSPFQKLSPHFVPKVLSNSAAGRVAQEFVFRGPNLCPATACAAGAHAVGEAARCIQLGHADVMLAGGAESCLDPWSLAGFAKLRALSTRYNDAPQLASRPFDTNRDGFVMAEGACVVVLEELEHARERLLRSTLSAPSFVVELVGYGATGDAYHSTSPDPDGRGAIQAMQMALHDASQLLVLEPQEPLIPTYVNAHATSTPKGDEIEARAIHQALCSGGLDSTTDGGVWVSSTKGQTGHLLGAAGALEAAFTVQSLLDQCLPATANLQQLDEAVINLPGLRHVREVQPMQEKDDYNVAMSNSFGFGGTNVSLLFQRISLE